MSLSTEEQQILYLIKADKDQARYFFSRAKSLKWFGPLKAQGYFSPESIPIDKDGHTMYWEVLTYLERVSEQTGLEPSYGTELLSIINAIVEFSQTKQRLDHIYIWSFCIKILNNIPNSIIKDNLSDGQFKNWLNEFLKVSLNSTLPIVDISERLLPKFLNDHTMSAYTEVIVEAVTRIKPKGQKHPLTREDETDLVWEKYWVLKAFEKYAKIIGITCSEKAIYTIADRLKAALEYRRQSFHINLEIDSFRYQIKVSRISTPAVSQMSFDANTFEVKALKYDEDQLKGIDPEKDYWAFHKIDPAITLKAFRVPADNVKGFVKAIKDSLPVTVSWDSDTLLEERLEALYSGVFEDYSRVWCRSLSEGPDHHSDAEEVLTIALRDVLLGKCSSNPTQAMNVLKRLLTKEYPFPIFRKCVLVCVSEFWAQFKSLFEEFMDVLPTSLHASFYEVEIYDILKTHNADFSPSFNQKLINFINDVPEYYQQEGEETVAYWKYKWSAALQKNPFFAELYSTNKEKAKVVEDAYNPRRKTVRGGFVKRQSPLSKEEILVYNNNDLALFLKEFQGADEWSGSFEGKPSKEGLKDVLQQAVKENPSKFYNDLSIFGQCHYDYVSRILWGFKEAWNAEQTLDWEKIFDFSGRYLTQKTFIEQAQQAQGEDDVKGRHLWVIDIISDLIEAGSRDDERAFDPKLFPKVYPLFDLMFGLVEGKKSPDIQRNAMNYAINTSLGHIIEAFIVFSWRVARVDRKAIGDSWGINQYERFLLKGIEGYIFLGRFLSVIKYLDEGFVRNKINLLASRNAEDQEWQVFLEGYLTGPEIDKDLYEWMRPNYIKAIENKVLEESIDQRMVQHITIAYVWGYEALDHKDSLFSKLLNDSTEPGKRDRWTEVVACMWSVSGRSLRREDEEEKPSEEVKKRILDFWQWVNDSHVWIQEKLAENYNAFLGSLAQFTILLDKIDDVSEKWLLAAVPYLPQYDGFFIEYLTKFDDAESLKRIGKIFLKLLETTTPIYKEEDIRLIVERIYEKGNPEDADRICTTYGRRGSHFLRTVWEENQKRSK